MLLIVVAVWHQTSSAAVIFHRDTTTVSPNNGNFHGRGNPNVTRLFNFWLGVEGRLVIPFDFQESGGTTEYAVNVSVENRSGVHWAGYRFSLGLLGERGSAPYVSPTGDGFGFDVASGVDDSMPQSSGALLLDGQSEDMLDFSGPFPDGGSVRFSFSFDVPDRLAAQQIVLIEQPTLVPEPSGVVLLAGGLGALALRRYRRARGRSAAA
jgi:hypothetical protein